MVAWPRLKQKESLFQRHWRYGRRGQGGARSISLSLSLPIYIYIYIIIYILHAYDIIL